MAHKRLLSLVMTSRLAVVALINWNMVMAVDVGDDGSSSGVCQRPAQNTLTTNCYGACSGATPLCVNYAAQPANGSNHIGDGNYYYQGCAFADTNTCVTNVTSGNCEVQCLQTNNIAQTAWVLYVDQPQADKAETSLFVAVDALTLPQTLKNLTIAGTTEASRKVPMSFAPAAFDGSDTLERINISDVSITNITTDVFPSSLKSLIIQNIQLQQFNPTGNFPSLTLLDLSDNSLTEIPVIIYDMPSLKKLYLTGNSIVNVHITTQQLAFLQSLAIFEGDMQVHGDCEDGYTLFTWDTKSVCYSTDDILRDSGSTSTTSIASNNTGSAVVAILIGLGFFAVIAVVAGMLLLKRAKRKANTKTVTDQPKEPMDKGKLLLSMSRSFRQRFTATTASISSDLIDPLQESYGIRKATFHDIPSYHVVLHRVVAMTGAVEVLVGRYRHTKPVYVSQFQVLEDAVAKCEIMSSIVPVLCQLRHPQLLNVIGLMCGDVNTSSDAALSVVSEYMDYGTLEEYLRRHSKELTWSNFKMKAAAEIAACLHYLHNQHHITYDALNGKSIFVDSEKGCKLNSLIASLPTGTMTSYRHDLSRAYLAPEILIGERSRPSSDMYAFGVVLAQLDSCESADEMIRHTWSLRGTAMFRGDLYRDSSLSLSMSSLDRASDLRSTSFLSMFHFTAACPVTIKELACACLQYDPSLRPSASYITAMLQQQS